MKKLLKILTLILSIVLLSTFMVACSKSPTLKEAKKNFKNEDYIIEDEEIDLEQFAYLLDMDIDDYESFLMAYDEDMEEGVIAFLFEKKSEANDFQEQLTDAVQDKIDDLLDEDFDDQAEALQGAVIYRVGKWVLFGTTDAIEIFQGE